MVGLRLGSLAELAHEDERASKRLRSYGAACSVGAKQRGGIGVGVLLPAVMENKPTSVPAPSSRPLLSHTINSNGQVVRLIRAKAYLELPEPAAIDLEDGQ